MASPPPPVRATPPEVALVTIPVFAGMIVVTGERVLAGADHHDPGSRG
jgi:hypothetical protein